MELNQIRYFLHLAETLNFTEAARLSGISQPSLTRAMQRLESELGARLIYRDGKDTRLTQLGRDLQVEFMRIGGLIDNVQTLVEHSVAGKREVLTIAVASTISPNVYAMFFKKVVEQLPSVELQVLSLLPGESEAELLSGKYNICLLTDYPNNDAKLQTVRLYEERMMLAMALDSKFVEDNIIQSQALADVPFLDRIHCEYRSQLIQHFMDRNIVMRPLIASDREEWVQNLTAAGIGVCVLPERSTLVDNIALREIEGLSLSRTVTMASVYGASNPREVRHILNMAADFDWHRS